MFYNPRKNVNFHQLSGLEAQGKKNDSDWVLWS